MAGFKDDLTTEAARKIVRAIESWRRGGKILKGQKRWIFELIQNALDIAKRISINELKLEIIYDDKKFIFRHNAGYFTPREFRALIFATSSKPFERESEYAGKFATGFLVSHIVNENVDFEGVLKKDEQYYSFKTKIRRKTNDLEEIKENFNKAVKFIDDAKPLKESEIDEFITTFKYSIEDEIGKNAIEKGVQELKDCLPFLFAFNNIERIIINGQSHIREINDIGNFHIVYVDPVEVWIVQADKFEIAIPINCNNAEIISLLASPRLYIKGLPIFETGNYLKIPFIIHSRLIETSEERESLVYEGNEDIVDDLIKNSFKTYFKMILSIRETFNKDMNSHNPTELKNLHFLIDFRKISQEIVENNRVWKIFNENIQYIVDTIIKEIPLVETTKGMIPISDTIFPLNSYKTKPISEQIFDEFYNLLIALKKKVPIRDNLKAWRDVIVEVVQEFSPDFNYLIYEIDDLQEELAGYVKQNEESSFDDFNDVFLLEDSKEFLLSFYQLAENLYNLEYVDPKYIDFLIPDQNGRISDFDWDNINFYIDDDIEEDFKQIVIEIGWEIKKELVNTKFNKYKILKDFIRETLDIDNAFEKLLKNEDLLINDDWPLIDEDANNWYGDSLGWIKLFNWCINKRQKLIIGFPILTKDETVVTINDFDKEQIIIPFEFMAIEEKYKNNFSDYEEIYPKKRIMHKKYFELNKEENFYRYLRNYKSFVCQIPLYKKEANLSWKKLIKILEEEIKLEKIDENKRISRITHELSNEDKVISELPFWNAIIGRISNNRKRAALFLDFIIRYLINVDDSWTTFVKSNCNCKEEQHIIIPSLYLASLKSDLWVPFKVDEGEDNEEADEETEIKIIHREASKDTLKNLIGNEKIHEYLKDYMQNVAKFLSHFDFDNLDLQIRIRSIKEGKTILEIRNYFSELLSKYSLDDLQGVLDLEGGEYTPEIVKLLEEYNLRNPIEDLIKNDPANFKKYVEDFKENFEKAQREREIRSANSLIGKNVEKIIRKIISDEGIDVEPTYIGGDLLIWPEEKEGWDSGLIRIEPYIMEIKFTSSTRAHLSKKQAEMALEIEEKYLVTVVENAYDLRERLNTEIDEDDIPSDLYDDIIDSSHVIDYIYEKFESVPNPEEVEPDIKGYWVKKLLYSSKENVFQWIKENY